MLRAAPFFSFSRVLLLAPGALASSTPSLAVMKLLPAKAADADLDELDAHTDPFGKRTVDLHLHFHGSRQRARDRLHDVLGGGKDACTGAHPAASAAREGRPDEDTPHGVDVEVLGRRGGAVREDRRLGHG